MAMTRIEARTEWRKVAGPRAMAVRARARDPKFRCHVFSEVERPGTGQGPGSPGVMDLVGDVGRCWEDALAGAIKAYQQYQQQYNQAKDETSA